jgi:UDP-3-O-[3-hydroxymyristoyl] glucosamine N-acyltransferase
MSEELESPTMPFGSLPSEMVELGENVSIEPFTTLGFYGFGFEKKGSKYKYPLKRKEHGQKLIIGDNVEIGSCTVIHRGSWRPTIIGKGTKIDSHVHIGHNIQIGDNCLIVTGTTIGGSATIGKKCFLGMNCTIKEGVKIADNVTIGMGAVVTKDITEPNTTWAGVPARKLEKK